MPTLFLRTTISSLVLSLFFACETAPATATAPSPTTAEGKDAILAVLNAETVAAFSRDYETWQSYWVHEPYVSKTYLNFADSSLSEIRGWEAVNQFLVDYFAEHPQPDPLPEPLTDIDVRLYGDGAWVTYEQQDPARGRKRESRLMERSEGKWRIAGMETVIYGE